MDLGARVIVRQRHLLLAWALAAGAGIAWSHPAWSSDCNPESVGVGLASGSTHVTPFSCRGVGETFLAADTLIQSISVWRPADITADANPRYLFVTGTDASLTVLLDAGPVVNTVGDGVHPVEYRWVFDPPFALPHPGEFFLDIQAGFVQAFPVLAATTNPYANGQAWEMDPSIFCSGPAGAGPLTAGHDLVFQVRFCGPATTPVTPRSWGRLKIHYR
jgi:hypothetical protein